MITTPGRSPHGQHGAASADIRAGGDHAVDVLREPPVTVCHCGRALDAEHAVVVRKAKRYRAGYASAVVGSQDQTAETTGAMKCEVK